MKLEPAGDRVAEPKSAVPVAIFDWGSGTELIVIVEKVTQ
jgi:hypothetical protein